MPNKKYPDNETFVCRFSGGSIVTLTLDYAKLDKQSEEVVQEPLCDAPTEALAPEFMNWMHTVMSHAAKKLDKTDRKFLFDARMYLALRG